MCGYLQNQVGVSIKRSWLVIDLNRSIWYYWSKKNDQKVIDKLSELTQKLPIRRFDEYFGRIHYTSREVIWDKVAKFAYDLQS